MMSQKSKLLAILESGNELTAKQIRARLRSGNPYSVVYHLRKAGYNVEMTTRSNSKGQERNFYRLAS